MKFNLSNFLELDTKALLAVNGGSDCGGGYSPPSNPSAGGGSKTPTGAEGAAQVQAEVLPVADTAAEHPTERRFMQIRIIKAEERIPSRQMRVAATAEISLEKMICHRFPM